MSDAPAAGRIRPKTPSFRCETVNSARAGSKCSRRLPCAVPVGPRQASGPASSIVRARGRSPLRSHPPALPIGSSQGGWEFYELGFCPLRRGWFHHCRCSGLVAGFAGQRVTELLQNSASVAAWRDTQCDSPWAFLWHCGQRIEVANIRAAACPRTWEHAVHLRT